MRSEVRSVVYRIIEETLPVLLAGFGSSSRSRRKLLRLALFFLEMLLPVVLNDMVKVGIESGWNVEGRAVGEHPITWSACISPNGFQPGQKTSPSVSLEPPQPGRA